MTLQKIDIDLPSDILLTINESEKELKQRIKTSLAVQLYQQKKVTIGKASQIANLTGLEFKKLLSDNEIPISNLEIEDVLSDIENLKAFYQ